MLNGKSHKILGGKEFRRGESSRIADCLRGDPVLAVPAVVVAAQHTEAHRPAAGQRMEEWLFLDGIELESADIPPGDVELSIAIEADPADAIFSGADDAAVTAGEALEFAVSKIPAKLPGLGMP